jgi:hypothetical protein
VSAASVGHASDYSSKATDGDSDDIDMSQPLFTEVDATGNGASEVVGDDIYPMVTSQPLTP